MAQDKDNRPSPPTLAVDVVEAGTKARRGRLRCELGTNITFKLEDLESYFFAEWNPTAYDTLLVAAVVEFADKTLRRSTMNWQRSFELHIPVHDPAHWNDKVVSETLKDALVFLTGDLWDVSFYQRRQSHECPQQGHFTLQQGSAAVIPFSEGLDSRCVAGLMAHELGDKLVRVRVGTKDYDGHLPGKRPFASIPYDVSAGAKKFVESTARSRGFKFAVVSGIAAFLSKASQIIVSESGQGALGPSLVVVGQAYEDYRSHPLFTARMEKFLFALLGHRVRFQFPRLWHTKAETLRKFVDECDDGATWAETWSCWQQNRHSSVDHKRRHCGICAACMLRRLSVHAAGLTEPPETYVWENLGALSFSDGAASSFPEKKKMGRMREYAIAGALHLDHLASLRSSPASATMLGLNAFQLGRALGLTETDARAKLDRMLVQHQQEWKGFVGSLGPSSFIWRWAVAA
jgi:7-cyano-7-deazaguanine synthase in queuosine biosynthesis